MTHNTIFTTHVFCRYLVHKHMHTIPGSIPAGVSVSDELDELELRVDSVLLI